MASNKNTKHGWGESETDGNDTTSLISADSGRGPSFAEVSSPGEEHRHHVSPNQDMGEETLSRPVEEESDESGPQTMIREPYNLTIPSFKDDKVTKISVGTRKGPSGVRTAGSGNEVEGVQNLSLLDRQAVPTPEVHILTYSHGQKVPLDVVEQMRSRGKGKTHEVGEVYSAFADHLQWYEEAKDGYLLPMENGLFNSRKEIILGSIVRVEQESRRGVFIAMETEVSKDRGIAYRPGQQTEGGNFLAPGDPDVGIGRGYEGTVYDAMDVLTCDHFAVKKMKIGKKVLKRAISSFLKLPGCEQTCRAYGVIIDEAEDCVYFLMELLEGNTQLGDIMGDQTVPIGIPNAVDYTIDILKGLQYIHSKGFFHSDINEFNIMIVGLKAIIIDTTGASKASCPTSLGYLWDVKNAINLLNNMLRNDTVPSPPPWKASAQDLEMFNKSTIRKLEHLLKKQAEYLASRSPKIDDIETLLQDLQEISEELTGPQQPSDSPVESVPQREMLASPEEFTKMQKMEEQEKRYSELQSQIDDLKEKEEEQEDFKRVNKLLKDQLEKVTKERNTFKAEAQEEKAMREKAVQDADQLRKELAALEVHAQKGWDMHDKAEQERKDLNDQLEALKAKMRKGQLLQVQTAEKDEKPKAEEGTERSPHSHPEPIQFGEGC